MDDSRKIIRGTVNKAPTERPPASSTLQDILQAITASREALKTKTDTLATDVGILREDQKQLAERVTLVERDLAEIPLVLSSADRRH
ncbi:hypothetical protein NDU88_000422 [Pleurodeles waltl]|uniref:Uncharacterized protein n=1 Tax=Pleurodeles waltl TaxID=8319 RepID=A0AAV7SA08_PLEWA|nr:hypothetical protein NDU88_000422 [Pleurodeles waltl]